MHALTSHDAPFVSVTQPTRCAGALVPALCIPVQPSDVKVGAEVCDEHRGASRRVGPVRPVGIAKGFTFAAVPSTIGYVHTAVEPATRALLEKSLSFAPRSDRARQDAGVRTPRPTVNGLLKLRVIACIRGHGLSTAAVAADNHSDATVRATFRSLFQQFVLRCRPVASIEAPTWLDLVVGDSTRDLSFVAHGPDGRAVTELRGAVTVPDGAIVAAEGTTIRPKRCGQTVAIVEVGDAEARIPIVVYQLVKSFVDNPQSERLMAMNVSLARGDTIEVPLPKAAFWVTYFSKDRRIAPPTIELQGDGSCTTGDGVRARRIEDGEYAKYCLAGNGTRMMIAHGALGAARVTGVVAIRLMW